MFVSLKKQVFVLFLAIGLIAPVFSMDLRQESSGWFGWKSIAGITVVVGASALWAYYVWTKPGSKRSIMPKTKTKQQKQEKQQKLVEVVPMGSTVAKLETPEEKAYAEQLKNLTPEFFASEKKRLDNLIAQLEREIAQERKK